MAKELSSIWELLIREVIWNGSLEIRAKNRNRFKPENTSHIITVEVTSVILQVRNLDYQLIELYA